jgi:acetylcholinesterase
MSASASDLLVGINAGLAIEPWPFRAVLDGPEGIMSDLPARRLSHGAGGRVPFMAGTVLDEGPFVSYSVDEQYAHTNDTATIFLPRGFETEDITTWLNANFTPSPLGPDALSAGMAKVLSVYPDDPSAGSPFGTGDETFGSGPGYKRGAAICTSSSSCFRALLGPMLLLRIDVVAG